MRDRFACEYVLEAEFVSILDGYATHGKCQEWVMAIAEFFLVGALFSGRWHYTYSNDPEHGGKTPYVDMRSKGHVPRL